MSEANRITGKVPPWWCPSSGDEAGTLLLQRWLSKWSSRSNQAWEDEFPHKNTDGSRSKSNELYYQAIAVSRRKTQIIITWSMVMIATCLAPLRLHQKRPITTFFFFICNFHLNIFLFILRLSSLLVAHTNLERKRLLKDIYMRIWDFLFHISALIIFFWMREFYGLEILDCCSSTEAMWTLASSSFECLICVFKLLCFRSLNSPRGPPSLATPVFFFPWLCPCLPPSQFCSSVLCSHGRWRLESLPPQLHKEREWRRHTWQTAECNPPKYLSSKKIRWGLLL